MSFATIFCERRIYRYTLCRQWVGGYGTYPRFVMFIGLNPSTADETQDDPTICRCIGFAKRWGYDGLLMTNLFALRATDPDVMKAHPEPVGPDNDRWLVSCAQNAHIVVAAWGTNGVHRARNKQVLNLLPSLCCLKISKDGHPCHPLYLPANLQPIDLKA